MGAIRDLINGLDQSDELVKEQNAHLDTLASLAESKVEIFKNQINQNIESAGKDPNNKTLPITSITGTDSETHAYLSSNEHMIEDAVSKAIDGFCAGGKDLTKGVAKILSSAISALFGDTESTDATISEYYIALDGDILVRLDVMGWKRRIEACSLRTKVEQVSAFVMSKAIVDMGKTDFATFTSFYQKIVNPDGSRPPVDVLKDAQALFDLLGGKR